jgi:hypothetical protein
VKQILETIGASVTGDHEKAEELRFPPTVENSHDLQPIPLKSEAPGMVMESRARVGLHPAGERGGGLLWTIHKDSGSLINTPGYRLHPFRAGRKPVAIVTQVI